MDTLGKRTRPYGRARSPSEPQQLLHLENGRLGEPSLPDNSISGIYEMSFGKTRACVEPKSNRFVVWLIATVMVIGASQAADRPIPALDANQTEDQGLPPASKPKPAAVHPE